MITRIRSNLIRRPLVVLIGPIWLLFCMIVAALEELEEGCRDLVAAWRRPRRSGR